MSKYALVSLASILSVFLFGVLFFATIASAQSVDNFHFSEFRGDYFLSRDDEGRSVLRVVERIVAEFPEFDQNKGIVRWVPDRYEGHPINFQLLSLKRNGQTEPLYNQYRQSGHTIIETGTNDYVRGRQVYQIEYTLRDVIKDFDEHQELHWDVNGLEWRQRFDRVVAEVHVDSSMGGTFVGEVRCFQGSAGSDQECDQHEVTEKGALFVASSPLPPGQTLTFVMKFAPSTFAPFKAGPVAFIGKLIGVLSGLLVLVSAVWLVSVRFGRGANAKSRGAIIARYTPPKGVTVLLVGTLKKSSRQNILSAQIVDLAVRGYLKIIEGKKKNWFSETKTYELELINTEGLTEDEYDILRAFFLFNFKPGARKELKQNDTVLAAMVSHMLDSVSRKEIISRGYRRDKIFGWRFFILPVVVPILGIISLVLSLGWNSVGAELFVFLAFSSILLSILIIIIAALTRPLTEKGRELIDHLKGLKIYIQTAEADRLKMLQSPDGAERIDANDEKQIIRLYERLLPYAILFGLEKQWAKELAVHYKNQNTSAPGWYVGSGQFNAAALVGSLSGFSSAIGASSSTTTGGSGFSGGGAGGGGGGGGGGGR